MQNFLSVEHVLGVNSGTSALICALVGAGIGPGDEVLVPAYTWVSTAAAPLAVGAVPILVDVDESLTIDPDDIRQKIGPHTKAVIPVHMLNVVGDMDAIMAMADEHDLKVIEDACQAVGVTYQDDVSARSATPEPSASTHKNIKSGEGGALLTIDHRAYTRGADVPRRRQLSSVKGRVETNEPFFVGHQLPHARALAAAILNAQIRPARSSQLERRRCPPPGHRLEELSGLGRGIRVSPHNDPECRRRDQRVSSTTRTKRRCSDRSGECPADRDRSSRLHQLDVDPQRRDDASKVGPLRVVIR